jgi:hypothetical protein
MKSRNVLKILAAVTGASAVCLALVTIASSHPEPAGMPDHSSMVTSTAEGSLQRLPDGTWASPLLPYAKPFASKSALEEALAEARKQGVIR